MITASLAALLTLASAAGVQQDPKPEVAAYSDAYLGLAFNIPKSWSIVKKTKDLTRYAIPLEGSAATAELEIIRSPFHSSKEIWQTIQLRTNESLRREVVRQWEQDVIEVPILFTQVNWDDKGVAKTTLSGLYYTRTPLKMLLRLTAPAADYEKVRYELQSALESLHTTNGEQPVEDDEDYKFEPTKKPQPVPDKPKVLDGGAKPTKVVKAPVTVSLTVSTKPVTLRLPEGWTASEPKDGKLELTHPKLSAPLSIEVRSVLDSEKALSALLSQTAATLELFQPGARRQDKEPTSNEAGATVTTVWRTGTTASGPLATFNASVEQGDFYGLIYAKFTNKSSLNGDQKLVKDLLEVIALEVPQP